MINPQSYARARQYALTRLEKELSPNLVYHSLYHTRDEVVLSAEVLAVKEGISGESLHLMCTAAWFHDIGFIEQADGHEKIGARIASEALPGFGYNPEQVEIVTGAIFATILPQFPTTRLEQVMADADLSVLGGKEFLPRSADLRRERAFLGREYSDVEWYRGQLNFIRQHQYFTASARALLDPQKKLNIGALEQILASLS
ncbi:MAG TPA: hypothetical protein VMT46_06145 [Anaerolineaceae bacterium]|nr:hypothetical protein [Anaerolineaceae bacterium]